MLHIGVQQRKTSKDAAAFQNWSLVTAVFGEGQIKRVDVQIAIFTWLGLVL